MKKAIAVFLSLALLCTGITVFAEGMTLPYSDRRPVTATYQTTGTPATVYSVDISWGDMKFTYTAGTSEWDPAKHEYVVAEGVWTPVSTDSNKITVTNHSNAGIEAQFSFAATGAFTDKVNGTFTKDAITLGSAENKGLDEVKDSTTLSLSGKVDSFTEISTIGTVTVSITAN